MPRGGGGGQCVSWEVGAAMSWAVQSSQEVSPGSGQESGSDSILRQTLPTSLGLSVGTPAKPHAPGLCSPFLCELVRPTYR